MITLVFQFLCYNMYLCSSTFRSTLVSCRKVNVTKCRGAARVAVMRMLKTQIVIQLSQMMFQLRLLFRSKQVVHCNLHLRLLVLRWKARLQLHRHHQAKTKPQVTLAIRHDEDQPCEWLCVRGRGHSKWSWMLLYHRNCRHLGIWIKRSKRKCSR